MCYFPRASWLQPPTALPGTGERQQQDEGRRSAPRTHPCFPGTATVAADGQDEHTVPITGGRAHSSSAKPRTRVPLQATTKQQSVHAVVFRELLVLCSAAIPYFAAGLGRRERWWEVVHGKPSLIACSSLGNSALIHF